jgi:hypothetical protein
LCTRYYLDPLLRTLPCARLCRSACLSALRHLPACLPTYLPALARPDPPRQWISSGTPRSARSSSTGTGGRTHSSWSAPSAPAPASTSCQTPPPSSTAALGVSHVNRNEEPQTQHERLFACCIFLCCIILLRLAALRCCVSASCLLWVKASAWVSVSQMSGLRAGLSACSLACRFVFQVKVWLRTLTFPCGAHACAWCPHTCPCPAGKFKPKTDIDIAMDRARDLPGPGNYKVPDTLNKNGG